LVLTVPILELDINLWFTKKHRLAIPTNNEYSVAQLRMMIREVKEIIGREITVEEWNSL